MPNFPSAFDCARLFVARSSDLPRKGEGILKNIGKLLNGSDITGRKRGKRVGGETDKWEERFLELFSTWAWEHYTPLAFFQIKHLAVDQYFGKCIWKFHLYSILGFFDTKQKNELYENFREFEFNCLFSIA